MSELKLEVGKYYRTRCGTKAKLMEFFEGQWFGAILSLGDRWLARQWHASGKYDPVFKTCGMDIVAEWNDDDDWEDANPSKITLDMLPMPARFKSREICSGWYRNKLYGYQVYDTRATRYCSGATWWDYCQVKKEIAKLKRRLQK